MTFSAKQMKQMRTHFSLVPNSELVAMFRVTRNPTVRDVVKAELDARGIVLTPNR